jgi:hypothetical protein
MQIRGLLAAAGLLVLIGGLMYWSTRAKPDGAAEEAKPDAPKILTLKEDEIQKLEIRRSDYADAATVVRSGGEWRITSPAQYATDKDTMSGLLSTFASLQSEKLIEEKASDFAPFGLKEPSLVIKADMKDGKSHTLLLGEATPTGSGFYARLAGDSRVFVLPSFSKASLEKGPQDLRDKRLITIDTATLARVELTAKKTKVEFGKNAQNEWQIVKPEPARADGWAVEELLRKVKDAKLDPLVPVDEAKKMAAAFGSAAVVAIVDLTGSSAAQRLEVRKDKDNRFLAKSSAIEGVHVLPKDLGEGMDKSAEDFRNKKVFDFGFTDPSKVEYKDGAKQLSLQKGGEKWLSGGKAMDSAGVQSLIDRLRDLSAVKFAAGVFGSPEIELAVTSNEGKRVEKVQIAKAGGAYHAKREGEATLYEIEASVLEALKKSAADLKDEQSAKPAAKK